MPPVEARADCCVVGMGYIGLPTAALAAASGLRVVGVDINPRVIESVNAGEVLYPEPGLAQLVREVVGSGALCATDRAHGADVYVIAVPTPFLADKAPDLAHVQAAARAIGAVLGPGDLVILESTSPPRTTTHVVGPLLEELSGLKAGTEFGLAYCPERVLPGRILEELRTNDRTIGGLDAASAERAVAFYARFVSGALERTDCTTAETVKLVENAYRDVNIAFANEVSLICARLGLDVWEVIRFANRHPRVNVLRPGVGVGGHCIGVDPWFLVDAAPEEANVIRMARHVNERKTDWCVEQILASARDLGGQASIGLLGASYKPDSGDLRESPALAIAQRVTREWPGPVRVCEPYAEAMAGLTLAPLDAVLRSDLIAICVGHRAFTELPPTTWTGKRVLDFVGLRVAG